MPLRKDPLVAALKSFREAAERSGVAYETSTDHALDTTLARVVSMHARYADLAVLGQVDPDEPPYVGHHLPEEVVLASGRPVLVVPHDWAARLLGERVLIAWDASREAARAVSDALPLLQRAEVVLVVSINLKSTPLGHGELPGADIALHLARHKLEVEVQSVETDRMEVADALLSFASSVCVMPRRTSPGLTLSQESKGKVPKLLANGADNSVPGAASQSDSVPDPTTGVMLIKPLSGNVHAERVHGFDTRQE